MERLMNVLLLGGGGREDTLAHEIAKSPLLGKLYAAPGNPGIARVTELVPLKPMDFAGVANFCREKSIDLVVVGPEDPLIAGLADYLRERRIKVFGPSQVAAQIEGSKAFAKKTMNEDGVPTAAYHISIDYEEALAYVASHSPLWYIKASGQALGKGAYYCPTLAEAENVLYQLMVERIHGDAGQTVVIEELLTGEELSVQAVSDGSNSQILEPSQDHKTVYDGDEGPNTGGMGAYSPVPRVTAAEMKKISELIVRPIVERIGFVGCLYPGLMRTLDGPKVLEYNCRFGDPETQALLPRLKTDLLLVLYECASGQLVTELEWHPDFSCCVVAASGGYGVISDFPRGFPITGIAEAEAVPGVIVYHAGTAIKGGELVTAGGRVLGVTARAVTLKLAIDRAYEALDYIRFQDMHFRHDIGRRRLSA